MCNCNLKKTHVVQLLLLNGPSAMRHTRNLQQTCGIRDRDDLNWENENKDQHSSSGFNSTVFKHAVRNISNCNMQHTCGSVSCCSNVFRGLCLVKLNITCSCGCGVARQMSSKESESQFWRGGPYDNRNNMSLFNFSQTLESVPCVVTQHNLQQTFSSAFPWINGSRRQIPTLRADDINILLEFPFVNIVLLSGLNQTNGRRGRCRAGPDKEVTLQR